MTAAASLSGTWTMLSFVTTFEDGTTLLPYGPKAEGRITYAADGFMAAHLWNPERHVAGAAVTADPAYFAYCGRWMLEGDCVHHHVLAATEPGWTGSDRMRRLRWDGDVLELTAEGVEFGGKRGRGVIRWRRIEAA